MINSFNCLWKIPASLLLYIKSVILHSVKYKKASFFYLVLLSKIYTYILTDYNS